MVEEFTFTYQEKQKMVENGIEQINNKIKKYDELMKKRSQNLLFGAHSMILRSLIRPIP